MYISISAYQENVQGYMSAATEFMHRTLDAVDGDQRFTTLLSDTCLAFVASNLGYNWSQIMLRLGVSQVRIEQLQMDYHNVSFHMGFNNR